jgi:flagellar biosynthesis protein FlhF
VVLSHKKVRQKGFFGLFKKKQMEVMVAYDPAKLPVPRGKNGGYFPRREAPAVPLPPQSTPELAAAPPTPAAAPTLAAAAEPTGTDRLDARIDTLDQMLSDFIHKFSAARREVSWNFSEDVQDLMARLVDNQVREELASRLAKETEQILRRMPGAGAEDVMQHLIVELLGEPAPVTPKKFQQKVILMAGPTGVGKTTSLVKLAASFALKHKRKVGIINTDTYRIAAQEQLKTYADILSIPLAVVYQVDELEAAMAEMADREVVFIDTAGKRPGDPQHQADLRRMVAIARPEDVLLCVAAPTSFSAIQEVVDTYDFFDDYKLLVTKLDETRYRGMLLNLCWYAKRRLAYVTTGQNVPDDIENVNPAAIASHILQKGDAP